MWSHFHCPDLLSSAYHQAPFTMSIVPAKQHFVTGGVGARKGEVTNFEINICEEGDQQRGQRECSRAGPGDDNQFGSRYL